MEFGQRLGYNVYMTYLLLFLEGIIVFISPCMLPLLPVYISYFAGGDTAVSSMDDGSGGDTGLVTATLKNALGFVLGFTIVFMTFGAFAGSIGKLLSRWGTAVNIVAGAIVILLGLSHLGIIRMHDLHRHGSAKVDTKSLRFFSSMLFGFVFSVNWTPCVGVFLGSALALASRQESVLTGVLMLLTFSLGLGIPFILSAVLVERLKGAFDLVKRNYRVINTVSGGLLVLVGLLMMTGFFGRFMALFDRLMG